MTAEDVDAFIDSLDPSMMRDATALRGVAAARIAGEAADENLVAAVRASRAAGDPWGMIGLMLRTSKADAEQKYAELIGEHERPTGGDSTGEQDSR